MTKQDARRIYMISMLLITAKKRYGGVKPAGIIRVLKVISNMHNTA